MQPDARVRYVLTCNVKVLRTLGEYAVHAGGIELEGLIAIIPVVAVRMDGVIVHRLVGYQVVTTIGFHQFQSFADFPCTNTIHHITHCSLLGLQIG